MTGTSGTVSGSGEGAASLDRSLWGAVLAALDCDDRKVRHVVYGAVMGIGLPDWDIDLDIPGALTQHLRTVGALPAQDDQAVAVVIPLRKAHTKPYVPPEDAG